MALTAPLELEKRKYTTFISFYLRKSLFGSFCLQKKYSYIRYLNKYIGFIKKQLLKTLGNPLKTTFVKIKHYRPVVIAHL